MVSISRRIKQRGLTLLEVLIAIMLMTTTLIAFAAVYPAAFKLNRKSQRSVQAAKYAAGVVEELRGMPLAGSLDVANAKNGRYLEEYLSWKPGTFKRRFPSIDIPEGFSLEPTAQSGTSNFHGIELIPDNDTVGQATFWEIRVTMFWKESLNERVIDKSLSIISARTVNR